MAFIRERSGGSLLGFILTSTLRFLQFVFAIAVIGIYARDLHNASLHGAGPDSKWAFAVAIGSLSAFTALVYGLIPIFLSSITVAIFAAWDIILFILWAAVFGLFGSMYIKEDPEMNAGIKRMKNGVWIDLINMLLWFISAIFGAIGFWKWLKGGRSLHTGRAHV